MTELATARIVVDPSAPAPALEVALQGAAHMLREGGLVAFPTETVYGLGADAFDGRAVARIFVAKGRPQDNPLIVHIADHDALTEVASAVPESAAALSRAFWPGPLTMVLPKSSAVPVEVTAGLDTVGVRMPSHPVAAALIRAAGIPIAAPSANLSGRPSPTTADHVWADLCGRVEAIVDGGPAGIGVESTVIDMTVDPPMVLRPGGATVESIRKIIPDVQVLSRADATGQAHAPRSPGLKYKHYAPRAEMWLVAGEWADQVRCIARAAREANAAGRRVGLMITEETYSAMSSTLASEMRSAHVVVSLVGTRSDLSTVASSLYGSIRRIDSSGVDIIYAESYEESGYGLAVMNRLIRAAGGRVIMADSID